jgi:predicted DNA-binding protein
LVEAAKENLREAVMLISGKEEHLFVSIYGGLMVPAANRERVRLSISVPVETKNKLSQLTHFQGKRMSDFIRETIEEKLSQMDRQNFEAQMKTAYQGLAEENIRISDDFKYADSENLY